MKLYEFLGYKSEKELIKQIKKWQKEGHEIKLIKVKKRPKILPCVCGCKSRGHWLSCDENNKTIYKLICHKCNLEGDWGHSEFEAIENYNKKVLEKQKEE